MNLTDIEESVTGQYALTDAEYEAESRALQKGYADPRAAYKVGVRDGAEEAIKCAEAKAEREAPARDAALNLAQQKVARLRTALELILADITEEGWELKGAGTAIRIAREALAGESQ